MQSGSHTSPSRPPNSTGSAAGRFPTRKVSKDLGTAGVSLPDPPILGRPPPISISPPRLRAESYPAPGGVGAGIGALEKERMGQWGSTMKIPRYERHWLGSRTRGGRRSQRF